MGCEIMLIKVVILKKLYKFYFDHFLIGIIVFLINMKNAIKLVENSNFYRIIEMYTENRARSASIVMRMCSLTTIQFLKNLLELV